MNRRLKEFLPVALFAFIPWAIILFVLSQMTNASRGTFIAVHYILDIALYAGAFHLFFKRVPKANVFRTTIAAIVSVIIFEAIFWTFFYEGGLWFLNYVDWIFPAFLITSTVYWMGKLNK